MSDESIEHPGTMKEIECPRCGYDVAVLRPREWADLVGTCPECGYGLDWSAIDSHRALLWFIEGKGDGRGVWSRWWRTLIRVLSVRMFFAEVKLENPTVLRRAAIWAVMLFVVLQLVYGTVVSTRRMISYVAVPPPPPPAGLMGGRVAEVEDVPGWIVSEFTVPVFAAGIQPTTGWPATVNWSRALWNYLDLTGSVVVPISPSYACFVSAGAGMIVLPVRALWAAIVIVPVLIMCFPWTRRRARVKPGHVIRATIYSLAAFVPVVLARIVIETSAVVPVFGTQLGIPGGSSGFDTQSNFWLVVAMLGSMLWLWWWWHAVLQKHWKLPHARAVLMSVIVIQCLVVAIILTMKFHHWFPISWL